MIKKSILLAAILILYTTFTSTALSSTSISPVSNNPAISFTIENFLSLSPKEFEKATGQHLSFKEKIGYRIIQWKLRKELKTTEKKDADISKAEKHSKNALFCGIVTWGALLLGLALPVIGLLSIPFSIFAIIFGATSLNKTSSNTRSIIGIVLGGLFLVLFAVALLTFVTI